jgi:hypothetical protein
MREATVTTRHTTNYLDMREPSYVALNYGGWGTRVVGAECAAGLDRKGAVEWSLLQEVY